jgi:predicted nucleic acid-binding protein
LAVESVTGDDELGLLVEFAASLGDGEAASAAIAISRGYLLATDDRKARRVVQSAHPAVELLTTSQLLELWQRRSGLPPAEMAAILKNVTARATFAPPKNDPARTWWDATLQASEKS